MKKLPLIVITGPSGRGKTEFSQRVANKLGYKSLNVGNLLEQEMLRKGITVEDRRDIGKEFFRSFDMKHYLSVLLIFARSNVILDGVRLAAGIERLRKAHKNLVHVHLAINPENVAEFEIRERFFDELQKIERMADLRILPLEKVEDIEGEIERRLIPLLESHAQEYQSRSWKHRSRSRQRKGLLVSPLGKRPRGRY